MHKVSLFTHGIAALGYGSCGLLHIFEKTITQYICFVNYCYSQEELF
jgi:hypothetical protein